MKNDRTKALAQAIEAVPDIIKSQQMSTINLDIDIIEEALKLKKSG